MEANENIENQSSFASANAEASKDKMNQPASAEASSSDKSTEDKSAGKPVEQPEQVEKQPEPIAEGATEGKTEEATEGTTEGTTEGKTEEATEEITDEAAKTEEIGEKMQPAIPVEEAAKPKVEPRWYVIQALTGKEDRVKQAILQTIELEGLKDKVFQVLVPTEEIVEIKGGKRVEKVRKMFPGYVFLEMILDEATWYHIRETAGVARFIGTKTSPTPVSPKEMQRVLKQLGKEERLEITFEKGEAVRVISGPFRGYTGTVDEVNVEKGKLKILINIFGRDTPVEVNFEHAQKIV
ncbi:MAG: transcription termination/antitermination protein NusG [bacterium]